MALKYLRSTVGMNVGKTVIRFEIHKDTKTHEIVFKAECGRTLCVLKHIKFVRITWEEWENGPDDDVEEWQWIAEKFGDSLTSNFRRYR